MPNISYGRRVRGLLEYLWGPGKTEEHEQPHIVAGYDDPAVLEPVRDARDPDRWRLEDLAARLEAPQIAAGERGMRHYVWQCSLSLPPQEGPLDDATWGAIATRFVQQMGFAGDAEQAGCRWIAVRHGASRGGNDHVHLVVTLATEDGAPVWLRYDKRRSQQVVDALEDEFGLGKWVRRDGATRRRATTRGEVERAQREGTPLERAMVRRAVRAALAGAVDEADWIRRMHASGLRVFAHPVRGQSDPDQVGGYSVSLAPRAGGERVWFAGRTLDGDLSLPRVRQRWAGMPALTVGQWRQESGQQRALSGEARMQVWRQSATALEAITGRMGQLPATSPQWPAIARSCADLLARVAITAEPQGLGPVSRAADILARAAAPRRADPVPVRSPVAEELGRVADALLMVGASRGAGEAALVMAVVISASRLVVALGELRRAQQQVQAAGAAQAAALRLMPLLRTAPVSTKTTTAGVPARDTVRPRIDRGRAGEDRDAGR